MTTWTDPHEPTARYQERLTPSPMALLIVFLAWIAVFVGPVHLYSIADGDEPRWMDAFLWGAGFGVLMTAILAVWNYNTTITINDHAIVAPARTVPLETVWRWTQLEGKALRKARSRLTGDQGGSHPIGIGIWALRGGRNKVFAPPWMPAGFLVEGPGDPILFGTRHPERFLAALETALGPDRAKALRDGGRPIRNGAPPEIRDAARDLVDDLMPRPSSNGQVHGRRHGSHDPTT